MTQEPDSVAPLAEGFPDLNFVATGGQFGRKRIYAGYVIARTDGGFGAWREGGLQVAGAPTLEGLQRGMCAYRNPYTGEAFTMPEPPKFKEELTPIGIQYVIPGCEKVTDDKTPAQLTLF